MKHLKLRGAIMRTLAVLLCGGYAMLVANLEQPGWGALLGGLMMLGVGIYLWRYADKHFSPKGKNEKVH